MLPSSPAFIRLHRSLALAVSGLFVLSAGADAAAPQAPPEQILAQEETGESGGDPSNEDAPVEGEPGPGDAVEVPPDEPAGDETPSSVEGEEKAED